MGRGTKKPDGRKGYTFAHNIAGRNRILARTSKRAGFLGASLEGIMIPTPFCFDKHGIFSSHHGTS